MLVVLLPILAGAVAVSTVTIILKTPRLQQKAVAYYAARHGYQVSVDHLALSLNGGLHIRAVNLTVSMPNNSTFFSTPQFDLTFDQTGLLKGVFFPTQLILSDPTIRFDTTSLKQGRSQKAASHATALIRKCLEKIQLIRLTNATVESDTLPLAITTLDLRLSPSEKKAAVFQLELSGKAIQNNHFWPFNIDGIIGLGTTAASQLFYAVNVSLRDIALEHCPSTSAFLFNQGRADFHMALAGGMGKPVQAKGTVIGQGIDFNFIKNGRKKNYALPDVKLAFDARLEKGVLHLSTQGPKGPGFALTTHTMLDVTAPQSPFLDLQIQSAPLSLATFKTLFPAPLLPQWLGTELFPIFSNGSAQLDGLRLKGSLAKIDQLNRRENADALAIRLSIKDVDAFANESPRPVKTVSGDIAVEDGQLLITKVQGRFGSSRLDELTLTFEDLYQSGQRYNFGVKGDFDLEDLKIQAPLKIIPRPIREFVDHFNIAKGRLVCDSRWFFGPEPPYLERITGTFKLGHGRLMHAAMTAPMQIESAELSAPLKKRARLFLSGHWRESQFQVDSKIDLEGYFKKPDRFPPIPCRLRAISKSAMLSIFLRNAFRPPPSVFKPTGFPLPPVTCRPK